MPGSHAATCRQKLAADISSLLFIYIRLTLNIYWLSVFRFVANEYKPIAIQLLSTIRNIWSAIWWAKMKVILNYLPFPKLYNRLVQSHRHCYVRFWENFRGKKPFADLNEFQESIEMGSEGQNYVLPKWLRWAVNYCYDQGGIH